MERLARQKPRRGYLPHFRAGNRPRDMGRGGDNPGGFRRRRVRSSAAASVVGMAANPGRPGVLPGSPGASRWIRRAVARIWRRQSQAPGRRPDGQGPAKPPGAMSRLVPHVAQVGRRRIAPRRDPAPAQRTSRPQCRTDAIGAAHWAGAPRLPLAMARPWPADVAPGSGSDRWDSQRGRTTCKCGNSHDKNGSPAAPGGDQAANVTGLTRRDLRRSQADQRWFSAWNPLSCQQP